MLTSIISIALISYLLSFLITPITIIIAKKFGLVDDPKVRQHPAHTHRGVIPRAGGVPIFIGIVIPVLLFFSLNSQIIGILIGGLILILVGLWDDKADRSPYIRLVFNIISTLVVVSSGIIIPYITNPGGGVINFTSWQFSFSLFSVPYTVVFWAAVFAFFWILWTTNIVGWSGGVDGQLPGFVAISAIIIGLLSLRFATSDPTQLHVTYLSFITAGAFAGFLPWNFYPQKIMPGYGGKTLAGFMLGVLSILAFSKLGTALLVLAVPMTDAVFMLIQRIFSGKSPVWATSNHLHHSLLVLGWGRRRIAFFYWFISALAGIAALSLNSQQKAFVAILILIIIIGFLMWLHLLAELPKKTIDRDE